MDPTPVGVVFYGGCATASDRLDCRSIVPPLSPRPVNLQSLRPCRGEARCPSHRVYSAGAQPTQPRTAFSMDTCKQPCVTERDALLQRFPSSQTLDPVCSASLPASQTRAGDAQGTVDMLLHGACPTSIPGLRPPTRSWSMHATVRRRSGKRYRGQRACAVVRSMHARLVTMSSRPRGEPCACQCHTPPLEPDCEMAFRWERKLVIIHVQHRNVRFPRTTASTATTITVL